MAEIGYYNYYNNPYRYTTDKVVDRYQEMVNSYENPDGLKSNNENPYSEENLAIRKLDEKLSTWAESVRATCSTEQEVRQLINRKYFGQDEVTYITQQEDEKVYAMWQNDYNAVCFGSIGGAYRLDPRLNYTNEDWTTEEANNKAFNQKTISSQMQKLLEKNNINLSNDDSLLISINPYSKTANVDGNLEFNSQISNILNGDNSKQLLYYVLQNSSNIDNSSLNKLRAYQIVQDYTGLDLSKLNEEDGNYYTSDGKNIMDIAKDHIANDNSIGLEFKGTAYEYTKSLLDNLIADEGWGKVKDLNIKVSYSKENGFSVLNNEYNA